jgi:hypothetical protein
MRALPLLAALPLLSLALLPASSLPLPSPAQAPPAVSSLLPGGPFTHVTCPGLSSPNPLRPLEVCNVRATGGNGPANEIDLALDPVDPQHFVVVGKGYNLQRTATQGFLNGAVITPYATTFDGGRTWTEGFLQPFNALVTLPVVGGVGGTPTYESDPTVDFLPDGSVLAVTLRTNQGGGLPVYKSTDGGRTFHYVTKAFLGSTDKNWMAVDMPRNIVYVATAGCGGICVTKSLDGGSTWSTPRASCNGCNYAGLDVGPNGEVHVIGYNFGCDCIRSTRSLDEGQTWSAQVTVGTHDGVVWNPANLRLYRTTNIQQLAVDKGNGPYRGSLYVAWAGHPANSPAHLLPCVPVPPTFFCATVPDFDVWLARSLDQGQTWSAPVRVNDDPTPAMAQFMPQVAVSPRGDVHVAWMDQRTDPTGLTTTAQYAHSANGGASFEPNVLVSDLPAVAELGHHQSAANLAFIGDYIGLQASDDRAVVAFPDERYGQSDIFVATIV